jgi:hypothetical protein
MSCRDATKIDKLSKLVYQARVAAVETQIALHFLSDGRTVFALVSGPLHRIVRAAQLRAGLEVTAPLVHPPGILNACQSPFSPRNAPRSRRVDVFRVPGGGRVSTNLDAGHHRQWWMPLLKSDLTPGR